MKLAIAVLLGSVAIVPAFGEERVRAQEPSVVTVRAKQQKVAATQKPCSKRGARVWSRLAGAPGWLLNASDDIPSPRERQSLTRQPGT